MAYTTIDNPELYFQTKLYSGNSSDGNAITLDGDENMQPDFVWIKERSSTSSHALYDTVRGTTKKLESDDDAAEETELTTFASFDSDGFTVNNNGQVNESGETYVAWCWKAGGSGSSNSDGAIATTRSVNTTAGFSIMKYTGSGSGSNIAHGLGATPELTIRKNTGGVQDWNLHTTVIDGSHDYFILNTTAAKADSSLTAPSSTLVYTAADSATFMVYAFKSIQGFSKFGSYTGNNNADGPFVYLGFKPSMVLFKRSSSTENWSLYDNKRKGYNPQSFGLRPNTNLAESEYGTTDTVDFLANGFKIRESGTNINNGTYVYCAWAESPFVNSNGVPCNAR